MPENMRKIRNRNTTTYRTRKRLFWLVVVLLLILAIFLGLRHSAGSENVRYIRAGICGAVNKEAVYTLREGSDLSMLVLLAKGFAPNADLRNIKLDRLLQNDSIYHIPVLRGNDSIVRKRLGSLSAYRHTTSKQKELQEKLSTANAGYTDNDELFSILYVGQPSVFILINYYPKQQRINFVHIPLSTIFLNNDYRIVDLFYTLDIRPTMQIVANRLNQDIRYYMIQDRFEFIAVIDKLGGVEINADASFAHEYKLKQGVQRLGGFHTWEYIRYIDWKNNASSIQHDRSIDLIRQDNFSIAARQQQVLFEMRNQRQRYVLNAMRQSFSTLSTGNQMKFLENFPTFFRTNLDSKMLIMLYKDILSTKQFSFGNLPGYYEQDSTRLYYYPDIPGYKSLYQQQLRQNLQKRSTKKQTIY